MRVVLGAVAQRGEDGHDAAEAYAVYVSLVQYAHTCDVLQYTLARATRSRPLRLRVRIHSVRAVWRTIELGDEVCKMQSAHEREVAGVLGQQANLLV